MPLFSIITVCKNSEKTISRTIESVLNQTYQDYEYIIVDGLSIDNTLNIINSYKDRFKDKLTVISEKDNGIYDAMNKGVDLAKGVYCIFMNAGDTFYNQNVLDEVSKIQLLNFDIVYGDAMHIYKNRYITYKAKDENYINFKYGTEFCHQSAFIKTSYIKENKYSNKYRIAGDYLFFLNAFNNGVKFKHIKNIVSIFDRNGISSNNGSLVLLENNKIQYDNKLIDYKKYVCVKVNNIIKKQIRNLLPKKIIEIRQKIILNNMTKNWDTINE